MKIRTLIVMLALAAALTVAAQTHPGVERGFKPELVYDFNGFDTVNLSNGNLLASIPLGQSYPVGEGLSYGVVLRYTGNLWNDVKKENMANPEEPPSNLYFKRTGDNAGFGWRISFGELYEGGTSDPGEYQAAAAKWRYVTADGGEHLFWETLHEPQCIAPITSNCDPVVAGVFYSRDNSYLRITSFGTNSKVVEFPNGLRHRFVTTGTGWRIDSIYTASSTFDAATGAPSSNYVKFDYVLNTATNRTDWKITDSHGREHWIRFSGVNAQVSRVDLEAFAGATATYTFEYDNDVTIMKPCLDASMEDRTKSTTAHFLKELKLPFDPLEPASAENWSFQYEQPSSECSDTSATMTFATLPTRGTIGWAYTSNYSVDAPTAVAVTRRSLYDTSTPPVEISRKAYTVPAGSDALSVEAQVNVGTSASPDWRAVNKTVEYRVIVWGPDFGLPFTKTPRSGNVPNPDSAGRWLSSETFSCDPATNICTPQRATYVLYEMDERIGTGCTLADPCRMERNRRVVSERTLYVSDGGRYLDKTYSRFDGLGHYRQVDTSGTFSSGNVRKTETEYNPSVGVYSVGSDGKRQAGHTMLAATVPWLLETYPTSAVTEGSDTLSQEHCFSSTTGLLLRQRVLAGTGRGAGDLLTVLTRNEDGNVTSEEFFGGDEQTLVTNSHVCGIATPAHDEYSFRADHTYNYGVRSTSRWMNDDGDPLPFFSQSFTIDSGTGLVSEGRDISGSLVTSYDYDLRGRLESVTPAGLAETTYTYTAATAAAPASVAVTTGTGATSTSAKYEFDLFGRIWREHRLMPDGSWSVRQTDYDSLGRRASVSEFETYSATFTPAHKTTFGDYDAFGRAGTMTAPDGKDTTFSYAGNRLTTRTQSIATANGNQNVSTTENPTPRAA